MYQRNLWNVINHTLIYRFAAACGKVNPATWLKYTTLDLASCVTLQLSVRMVNMANAAGIVCRCCGNSVTDHKERRKLRSPAGAAIVPTLTKLLRSHLGDKKSAEEPKCLLFPPSVEPYICRKPCLVRLQRLQRLEKDLVEVKTSILSSLDSLYPQSLQPEQPTASMQLLEKRTPTQANIESPPAKRTHTESPVAHRQLNFAVLGPPDVGKSPGVAVC